MAWSKVAKQRRPNRRRIPCGRFYGRRQIFVSGQPRVSGLTRNLWELALPAMRPALTKVVSGRTPSRATPAPTGTAPSLKAVENLWALACQR